jgi:hypothetical protein
LGQDLVEPADLVAACIDVNEFMVSNNRSIALVRWPRRSGAAAAVS